MEQNIIEILNNTSIQETDNNDKKILIFIADWSEPAKKIAEIVKEIAVKYPSIKFYLITDENQEYSKLFAIKGYPTIIYSQNNETISSNIGYMDRAKFVAFIDSNI